MTTLSAAMDQPLTVLLRVAQRMAAHPEMRGELEMMVCAVQVLEAVRIGVARMEDLGCPPAPAAVHPCAVVNLAAVRAARIEAAAL